MGLTSFKPTLHCFIRRQLPESINIADLNVRRAGSLSLLAFLLTDEPRTIVAKQLDSAAAAGIDENRLGVEVFEVHFANGFGRSLALPDQ